MKNYSKRGKKVSRGKTRRMKAGGWLWDTPEEKAAKATLNSTVKPSMWERIFGKPSQPSQETVQNPLLTNTNTGQNPLLTGVNTNTGQTQGQGQGQGPPPGFKGGKHRKGKSQRKRN